MLARQNTLAYFGQTVSEEKVLWKLHQNIGKALIEN